MDVCVSRHCTILHFDQLVYLIFATTIKKVWVINRPLLTHIPVAESISGVPTARILIIVSDPRIPDLRFSAVIHPGLQYLSSAGGMLVKVYKAESEILPGAIILADLIGSL